jgi:hypothetical protein
MSRRLELTFVDPGGHPVSVDFSVYSGPSTARRNVIVESGSSPNGHVGLALPDTIEAVHVEIRRSWRDEVHDFAISGSPDDIDSHRVVLKHPRVALVLSGGGFRATLFHLGVVSYLRAVSHLSDVVYVAGVSGGALMAAHLVARWQNYLSSDVAFVSADLRELMKKGFRLTSRAEGVPSEDFVALVSALFSNDTREFTLNRLGEKPFLALFATETTHPGLIAFTRNGGLRIPSQIDPPTGLVQVADDAYDIGRAVACSAAFPGYFRPIPLQPLSAQTGAHGARLVQDGGLLDNTGLFGTMRLKDLASDPLLPRLPDFDYVLLSDAGKLLQTAPADRGRREVPGGIRSVQVAMDASREHVLASARKRWAPRLMGEVSIGDASNAGQAHVGYAQATARLIAMVRTDLDAFPKELHEVIGHHGYARAHAVLAPLHMQVPKAATLFSTRHELPQAELDSMLTRAGGVRLLDLPSLLAFLKGGWQWW